MLCRRFGIEGWPGERSVERQLWTLADDLMPATRCADYTQAIMDLGATVCRRAKPLCSTCPFAADCRARQLDAVERLPAARPRPAPPRRECVMLILLDGAGQVLLQRRDSPGVWQGLWSLPQFDEEAAARGRAGELGNGDDGCWLAPVDHAFSHYRLQIRPLLMRTDRRAARIGDNPAWRWIRRAELIDIGLPAPVRRLLADIKEFH